MVHQLMLHKIFPRLVGAISHPTTTFKVVTKNSPQESPSISPETLPKYPRQHLEITPTPNSRLRFNPEFHLKLTPNWERNLKGIVRGVFGVCHFCGGLGTRDIPMFSTCETVSIKNILLAKPFLLKISACATVIAI